VVRDLVDAVDPDVQAKALEDGLRSDPSIEPVEIRQQLVIDAVKPLASNPDLRSRILELRRAHDRIIDEVSTDVLLDAYGVVDPGKAMSVVESWRSYLDEHRSEITAIQLLAEARERRISFGDIKELADRISRPPYNWTPDIIWNAYVALEPDHGKASTTHRTLTDLVSLIRFTLGEDDQLVPYADKVHQKYAAWLAQQEQAGVEFTPAERWWLDRMVQVIASSAGISAADLDQPPFIENGGTDGALRDLGDRAAALIDELNKELTA
jgi:type I restriction enzyme R subunit